MRPRRAWRVVPLVALLLLASGCLRFRGDLTVGADGLVPGTLVIGLKVPPEVPDEPLTDEVPADLEDKVTVEPYREDGYRGHGPPGPAAGPDDHVWARPEGDGRPGLGTPPAPPYGSWTPPAAADPGERPDR